MPRPSPFPTTSVTDAVELPAQNFFCCITLFLGLSSTHYTQLPSSLKHYHFHYLITVITTNIHHTRDGCLGVNSNHHSRRRPVPRHLCKSSHPCHRRYNNVCQKFDSSNAEPLLSIPGGPFAFGSVARTIRNKIVEIARYLEQINLALFRIEALADEAWEEWKYADRDANRGLEVKDFLGCCSPRASRSHKGQDQRVRRASLQSCGQGSRL